jgi:hypothetical protein
MRRYCCFWNRKLLALIHKMQPAGSVWDLMDACKTDTSYFFKVHLNITLASRPFCYRDKSLCKFIISTSSAHCILVSMYSLLFLSMCSAKLVQTYTWNSVKSVLLLAWCRILFQTVQIYTCLEIFKNFWTHIEKIETGAYLLLHYVCFYLHYSP